MSRPSVTMQHRKQIALVAHDHKKRDLIEWIEFNKAILCEHELYATGTTGRMVEEMLGMPVTKFQSGPLGGDQQIGAKIAEGVIDFVIFFWDPMEPTPHDPDVKALLRLAAVWNIPVACNWATADFLISSPLMHETYKRLLPDYDGYRNRLSQPEA
jgi:methylglyoxal synthase